MTERDSSLYASSEDDVNSYQDRHDHEMTSIPTETNGALEKQSSAASGRSVLERRASTLISTIRSREPGQTARFTHPLSHTKTTEDVIVDFDGPDDPYMPLNWNFKKKAVTTLLYGLTTMGMLRFQGFTGTGFSDEV